MKPLVLINFKTYREGTGERGLRLAKTIAKVSSKYQLALAPQLVDLKEICRAVKLPIFAQHLDNISYGAYTGSLLPEGIKEAGAKGTLLNHSEKRLGLKEIKELIKFCKKLGLVSVVCAPNLRTIKKIAQSSPDYLAYEPKKLIGTSRAVTQVNPKVITKAVNLLKKTNPKIKLLCGAGIHSKKDLRKAFELGAQGVLLSHKIVKVRNPGKVLEKLLG